MQRGYRILARNYRRPWGEADIIARDPGGTAVIVEVRSRGAEAAALAALESVDAAKQRQLRRLARGLLTEARRELDLRIDVIAVGRGESGRLEVRAHLRGAVEDARR